MHLFRFDERGRGVTTPVRSRCSETVSPDDGKLERKKVMRFKKYIKQYKDANTLEGLFAEDVLADKEFPRQIFCSDEKYHTKIYNYLRDSGACRAALEAFEIVWRDYVSCF